MTFTGSRWLRIAPAFAVVVLASLGVVGAISERDAIATETHARGLAAGVRPLALHEAALLEKVRRSHTRASRDRFFAVAQRQTAVLSELGHAARGVAPQHNAALTAS